MVRFYMELLLRDAKCMFSSFSEVCQNVISTVAAFSFFFSFPEVSLSVRVALFAFISVPISSVPLSKQSLPSLELVSCSSSTKLCEAASRGSAAAVSKKLLSLKFSEC